MSLPDTASPSRTSVRFPLSLQQEFLCGLDKGDETGSFGAKHTVTSCWRLTGPVQPDALRGALDDLVRRHEMLRTVISRGEGAKSQEVHPPGPVQLTIRDLSGTAPSDRNRVAQELLNTAEAARYPVRELPHLRAWLGRFDDADAVLVLVVHHLAGDGWSMRVLIRDLAAFYAIRRRQPVAAPPPVRQYREFVTEQRDRLAVENLDPARRYWREKLRGARFTAIPIDRQPAEGSVAAYCDRRRLLDREVTGGTLRLAREARCTPFMAYLAVFTILLGRRAGTDDVVVGSFTSGRAGMEAFHDTVGPFLNFLPLRTDLSTCRTFRDVLGETRTTCLRAYTNEIPFPLIDEEAPGLMESPDGDILGFEVLQFPGGLDGQRVGDVVYSELRARLLSAQDSCDIPEGGLWALDVLPELGTVSSLKYDRRLFADATMTALADDYSRLLHRVVEAPDAPL